MRIKILEMSRDLKDLENVLAAHVGKVVENWCLVISVLKGEMRLYDYIVDKELKQ